MKTQFNQDYLIQNSGCYDLEKTKSLSFMKNKEFTLLDIVNSEIPLKDKFWFVTKKCELTISQNQEIAIGCAEIVLVIYEKKYPKDKRPAEAIQAAKDYLYGIIDRDELIVKRRAAAAADAAAAAAADAADAAAADAAYAYADAAYAAAAAAAADAAAYAYAAYAAAAAAADAADAAAYAYADAAAYAYADADAYAYAYAYADAAAADAAAYAYADAFKEVLRQFLIDFIKQNS